MNVINIEMVGVTRHTAGAKGIGTGIGVIRNPAGVTRNPAGVTRPTQGFASNVGRVTPAVERVTPTVKLSRGFTLLELLVVVVIVGVTLGMVSFSALPGAQQVLEKDAQRIALLLQLARDEAIVRNRPIAFEVDAQRYRFLLREENSWQLLTQDDLLREREFKRFPVMYSVNPSSTGISPTTSGISPPSPGTALPLRIVFGREPVDKPFVLTLNAGEAQAAIRADGIGHFVAE